MCNYKSKFKTAFTLMEIGISLLIVSILIMLTIPIITNQAKKTDEYAYYAAFKTVEKMGAQIVAYGDPGNSVAPEETSYNSDSPFDFKDYIADYVDRTFKVLNPKAYALQTSEIVSFPSYEYDYVRLCLGNPNVVKDYDVHAGNTWSAAEILTIQNQSLCKSLFKTDDFIKKRFMCSNMSLSTVKSMLSSTTYNAFDYCKWLSENCTGAYNCNSASKNCYTEVLLSQTSNLATYGECIISINDPDLGVSPPSIPSANDTTVTNSITCDKYGFYGMTNLSPNNSDTTAFECSCGNSGSLVLAENNKNICCPTPSAGYSAYYVSSSEPCKNCLTGAFNEKTGQCCPSHSYYSASIEACSCQEGYTPNETNTGCNSSGSSCPAGSHLVNGNCISNSPIISAKRFCELVAYNWNVSEKSCNTFKENPETGVAYNENLYNAITAGNTKYLSSKAVVGAFNNLEPNIIFSNGLRMWILSDKSASIAGLSYNPDDYEPEINVCRLLTDSSCAEAPNYYCKTDVKCFTVNAGSSAVALKDARNCCSTSDLSDLVNMYEGKDYLKDSRTYAINGFTVFIDINGTKDNDELGGGGTLWKDVFPFYISSNGTVYPAYPLNAAKASGEKKDSSSLFQGGNSSALSADVFYYDIVNNKRKKINVFPSIPYARAMCLSINISAYTPYCQNLGSKFRHSMTPIDKYIYSDSNPCFKHRCFVKLKNKIKFL